MARTFGLSPLPSPLQLCSSSVLKMGLVQEEYRRCISSGTIHLVFVPGPHADLLLKQDNQKYQYSQIRERPILVGFQMMRLRSVTKFPINLRTQSFVNVG